MANIVAMGTRNPDKIPMDEWRRFYPTVDKMIEGRWRITGRCRICELKVSVSLALIARLSGGSYSLWGTTRACPREDCSGRVQLLGKPPQKDVWVDISRTP